MHKLFWPNSTPTNSAGLCPSIVGRRIAFLCVAMVVAPLGYLGCTRNHSPVERAVDKQGPTEAGLSLEENLPSAPPPSPSVTADYKPAPDDPADDPASAGSAGAINSRQVPPDGPPRGDWTMQRLIVLSDQGPCMVDLAISIAGQSLEQTNQEQQAVIADELLTQLESPRRWEDLLELPLVRSGWLGNLLASAEQRSQLISLYDTQRDDLVARDELPAFLSRGLARAAPLKLNDEGFASDHDPNRSPWGSADRNRDFSLDFQERMEFAASVTQQDLNADGVLTRRELADAGDSFAASNRMSRGRSSLLQANSLLLSETWLATLNASQQNLLPPWEAERKQLRKLASDLLRHYTFLAELAREQWPDWSDQRWQRVDRDGSQSIDQGELQQWLVGPPQVQLFVTLPPTALPPGGHSDGQADSQRSAIEVQIHDPAVTWQQSAGGGQLTCGSCATGVELSDVFNAQRKLQLRQQLQQALIDPQLGTFLQRQLELDATAFELLDQDHNAMLSDQEFDRVWQWLSSRNSGRVTGRWMLSAHPWFQLADKSADGRLAEWELPSFTRRLAELDRNGDAQLTPNELPLVSTLALGRSDPRLEMEPAAASSALAQAADSDWFSAMDTNRDGSISRSEFLGENDEFSALDGDRDGFLSRGDVYFPKASK